MMALRGPQRNHIRCRRPGRLGGKAAAASAGGGDTQPAGRPQTPAHTKEGPGRWRVKRARRPAHPPEEPRCGTGVRLVSRPPHPQVCSRSFLLVPSKSSAAGGLLAGQQGGKVSPAYPQGSRLANWGFTLSSRLGQASPSWLPRRGWRPSPGAPACLTLWPEA